MSEGVVPDPMSVFKDTHFHVCPKCLHIWSHTTAQAVMMGTTKAHRCPECKKAQGGMGWLSMSAAVTERGKLRAAQSTGTKQDSGTGAK